MESDYIYAKFAAFDTIFHKVMNKMKRIEQKPRYFGTDILLYPSEIHTIDAIGKNPGINVTDLAVLQGVTKGAVSQVIRKLVDKEMVVRMKDEKSDREVLLMLSPAGKIAYTSHQKFHSRIDPILLELIEEADEEKIAFMVSVFKAIERFCDQVLEE
ncbi:MarR family transcriptional regulator [Desulfoluna spongiiphila]|uniref:DNA-binding transcriptional regulator, MarR family n=1 Tax=Desulfoluna spongiiphila TaxID=419481 RepID=A0A1G5FHS7_9BACT|nr:MarR family transcriptional regulator [Desulfoluna spongiiphila]SCY38188.1 DNA-binding transcriptional regulator, MarR family [Desulfoluna spongiiphila]VVS95615.1 marr-type hth domain [Desulfoluna spongiiphila]